MFGSYPMSSCVDWIPSDGGSMVREDTVRMSMKELKRVHVRRLIQRVRAEGDAGLVHWSRGTPSNRRYRPALKARVLRMYVKHYGNFGPTLGSEKLGGAPRDHDQRGDHAGLVTGRKASTTSRGGSVHIGPGGSRRAHGGAARAARWLAP